MVNSLKAEKVFIYAKDSRVKMNSNSISVHTEILVSLFS